MARRNQSPVPMRRCVGCMKSREKNELVRVVLKDGKPIADFDGKAEGRGCYIHGDIKECMDKAFGKKGLNRAFRCGFDKSDLDNLRAEIERNANG